MIKSGKTLGIGNPTHGMGFGEKDVFAVVRWFFFREIREPTDGPLLEVASPESQPSL
jgi:hypothetical protein